jgi:hypothetical protein
VIEAVVYFNGPATQWGRKVDEREVIARRSFPVAFLAHWFARSTHSNLDPARCGYVVRKGGVELKHVEPLTEQAP